VHVVESWEPYALVGVGYFSMTLNQLALNTRSLAATLATSTAVDPVVSVALGLALFDEQLHANGLQAVAAFVALAAALLGVVVLARAEAPETMVAQPSGSS
jgi:multidrug transporter EmrE-like cation transporter